MEWEERLAQLLSAAIELHRQRPSWPVFLQRMWLDLLPDLFPSAEDRRRLESTAEYAELVRLTSELSDHIPRRPRVEHRVLFLRIPMELHEILKIEAARCRESLNRLCMRKLVQPLPDN